jgi:heme A synthase
MSTAPLELPTAPSTPASPALPDPGERDRLIRRAKTLCWLSLAYMTAEGAIGVTAAVLAGSVALLGFGLDSAIEGFASVIVVWRFTGSRRLSQHAERRAERMVAASFFLLAPYIAQDAIRTL